MNTSACQLKVFERYCFHNDLEMEYLGIFSWIFRILPIQSSIERMNFFLRDVWKQSKIVFAFFVAFILGTIWCTFSKIEITPFFLWAHYSDKQIPTGKFDRIYITVNGEILDLPKLSRPTREMIQLPTEYFVRLEKTNYDTGTRQLIRSKLSSDFSEGAPSNLEEVLCNSVEQRSAYLSWLAKYIERIYGNRVLTLEVGTNDLVFQKDRSVKRGNSVVIGKFSRP
ncbi:MAG: hypothetical protein P8P74_07055 [Crocinitomicaceae bacterium]|nr:hypothetical protein [Crocinitomicaceae bacterium]